MTLKLAVMPGGTLAVDQRVTVSAAGYVAALDQVLAASCDLVAPAEAAEDTL